MTDQSILMTQFLNAHQAIHWRAALKGSHNGGRCDESVPIEAVQQIPVVMDPCLRRDVWGEFWDYLPALLLLSLY